MIPDGVIESSIDAETAGSPSPLTKLANALGSIACVGLVSCASDTIGPAQSPSNPHPYDFLVDEGSTYVRNERVTLRREYWIVYEDTGAYYVFPRPDGATVLERACMDREEIAQVLINARLCHATTSADEVARINALTRDEAMLVSAYLHEHLVFEAGDVDTSPRALVSDIIDVCRTFEDAREGTLASLCRHELSWLEAGSRPDVGVQLMPDEVEAVAEHLNKLYGIER